MRVPLSSLVKAGFGLALIILCAVSATSYWAINAYIDSAELVSHSHLMVEKLGHLLRQLADVESATRAYVISGDRAFLEAHSTAARQAKVTLTELRHLAGQDSRERDWVAKMEMPVEEKLAFDGRTAAVRDEHGFEEALRLVRGDRGRRLGQEIRIVVNGMEEFERDIQDRRSKQAASQARTAIAAVVSGTLLSITMLLLVYLDLMREIDRRRTSQLKLIHLNRLHAVLTHVSQAVVRSRDRDELLHRVCRIAVEDGQFRMAWVGLVEPGSDVRPVAHYGYENGYLDGLHISVRDDPQGRGPTGTCLRQGRYYICHDIATDPIMVPWRDQALERGYRSSAAFPLVVGGRLIGALCVYASETGLYRPENVNMLDEIATELSFALQYLDDQEQRRRAEEQVVQLNQELEQRVEVRTAELNVANQQLAARNQEVELANRMKSAFLARMSHELRTPLNAIIGFADLLAEGSAGDLGDKQKRFVGHVQAGSRHLLQVINDILDLSKIDAGRIELVHEEFLASEALTEVLAVIRPLAEIKHIAVETALEPDLSIYADRTRLKQIFYNLLSNAVKFTPEGGRVGVDSRWQGSTVCFTVADTGVGIPPDEHQAIFDEFHQVSETAKGHREGTGLGLAITRRLVELHGGEIWVESAPAKGSRFYFTLPPGSAALGRAQGATQ